MKFFIKVFYLSKNLIFSNQKLQTTKMLKFEKTILKDIAEY